MSNVEFKPDGDIKTPALDHWESVDANRAVMLWALADLNDKLVSEAAATMGWVGVMVGSADTDAELAAEEHPPNIVGAPDEEDFDPDDFATSDGFVPCQTCRLGASSATLCDGCRYNRTTLADVQKRDSQRMKRIEIAMGLLKMDHPDEAYVVLEDAD